MIFFVIDLIKIVLIFSNLERNVSYYLSNVKVIMKKLGGNKFKVGQQENEKEIIISSVEVCSFKAIHVFFFFLVCVFRLQLGEENTL